MNLTKNAEAVLERRYLIRDSQGKLMETPEELFRRVAAAVAASDCLYGPETDARETEKTFYQMMTSLEFLPNSPTLMNAGRPLGQLSACFVLPVEDSMEDIFEAVKQAALIHKSGGGTGFSFSRLRRKGSAVNSTGGVASGPVSFMRVFNMATEAVRQGGTRRGANMGVLRVDHPDILDFISCKSDNRDITNFNISIGLTERFMEAVQAGEDYDLIDPHTRKTVGRLSAPAVFDRIVDAAWRNGEPGILFLDRLNRDNVVPTRGEIEATNPCGEQPLLPYESCNLGSVNLARMLCEKNGGLEMDWDRLSATVRSAVHFLDNVIDANRYPLESIAHATRQTRKIGLGVMGWADCLLRLGIPYDAQKAQALGEKVMAFITARAREESAALAEKRGAFPLFEQSTLPQDTPMRNATVTTIAPTGTLSILAGCSSGVEPVFAFAFVRNIMDGSELTEGNPVLLDELEKRGLRTDSLMQRIAREGTLSHMTDLPEDLRQIFVTAHDISPEAHIRMQAAFQRHTDNAVSKTVNFRADAARGEVAEAYRLAYCLGCKGLTIYRDKSRGGQVLNIGGVSREETAAGSIVPRPRPQTVTGITERVKTGCGNLYITVNYDDRGICEVFTNTGKAGGCPSQSEATARLISIALRGGMEAGSIIDQLRGIRCPSTIRQQGLHCTSCPDAIARVMESVCTSREKTACSISSRTAGIARSIPGDCPECGTQMEREGGCVICRQCGYSHCG